VLASLLLSVSSHLSDANAAFLRRLSYIPKHVKCPDGLIDHTNGNAFWWECGRSNGCPGAFPWADVHCRCACVLPTECVAKTPEDPCVTSWEADAAPVSASTLAPVTIAFPTQAPSQSTPLPEPATESPPLRAPQTQTTAPAGFLKERAATTAPPAPAVGGSALVVILCIVLAFGLGCLALFCRIWFFSQTELSPRKGSQTPSFVQPTSRPKLHHERNEMVQSGLPTLLGHAPMHKKHAQPKQAWATATNNAGSSFANTPAAPHFTLSALPCSSSQQHRSPQFSSDANLVSPSKQSVQEKALPRCSGDSKLLVPSKLSCRENGSPQFSSEATVCKAAVRNVRRLPVIYENVTLQ